MRYIQQRTIMGMPVLRGICAMLLAVSLLSSCSSPQEREDARSSMRPDAGSGAGPHIMRQKPGDTSLARRTEIFDSLLAVLHRRGGETQKGEWRAAAQFPREWVTVKMTDTSFVIYDPCDGRIPRAVLGNDSLTFLGSHEDAVHAIREFRLDDPRHAVLRVSGWGAEPVHDLEYTIELVDPVTGLSIWRQSDDPSGDAWGMVPAPRAALLPVIAHPCEKMKEEEYDFLKIP